MKIYSSYPRANETYCRVDDVELRETLVVRSADVPLAASPPDGALADPLEPMLGVFSAFILVDHVIGHHARAEVEALVAEAEQVTRAIHALVH